MFVNTCIANPLNTCSGNCDNRIADLFLGMEASHITKSIRQLTKREQKFCVACERPVNGRTDKKFCNEVCRNGFNNRLNAESNNLVRNINHALNKNRRVMESFFCAQDKLVITTANQLLQRGFLFKYSTHQYTNKKGNTYFFCYDFGYLVVEDKYLLVRGRD